MALIRTLVPGRMADSRQFAFYVRALIEREPAVKALCFTRGAVRKLRVRMHAGAGRIAPSSLTVFPCCNNPAVPGSIVTCHEGFAEYLVIVTHRIELRGALEHDA